MRVLQIARETKTLAKLPKEKLEKAVNVAEQKMNTEFPFVQNDFIMTFMEQGQKKESEPLLEVFTGIADKIQERFPHLQMPTIQLPLDGSIRSKSFQKARAQLRRIVRIEPEIGEDMKKMLTLMKDSEMVKELQRPTDRFVNLVHETAKTWHEAIGKPFEHKKPKINLVDAYEDLVQKVLPKEQRPPKSK